MYFKKNHDGVMIPLEGGNRLYSQKECVEIIHALSIYLASYSDEDIHQTQDHLLYSKEYPVPKNPVILLTSDKKSLDVEKDRSGFVYVVGNGDELYKIGMTKDIDRRFKEINKLNPSANLAIVIPCEDMKSVEGKLHRTYADFRQDGEWFKLRKKDLTHIKNMYSQNGASVRGADDQGTTGDKMLDGLLRGLDFKIGE